MKEEIQEYQEAVEAHIQAAKDECVAKDKKRKAYYRLIRAKDAMRAKEHELLNNYEL